MDRRKSRRKQAMQKLILVKSYRNYILVWVALLLLTFVTWRVSFIPLGLMNVTVAMIIASLPLKMIEDSSKCTFCQQCTFQPKYSVS